MPNFPDNGSDSVANPCVEIDMNGVAFPVVRTPEEAQRFLDAGRGVGIDYLGDNADRRFMVISPTGRLGFDNPVRKSAVLDDTKFTTSFDLSEPQLADIEHIKLSLMRKQEIAMEIAMGYDRNAHPSGQTTVEAGALMTEMDYTAIEQRLMAHIYGEEIMEHSRPRSMITAGLGMAALAAMASAGPMVNVTPLPRTRHQNASRKVQSIGRVSPRRRRRKTYTGNNRSYAAGQYKGSKAAKMATRRGGNPAKFFR